MREIKFRSWDSVSKRFFDHGAMLRNISDRKKIYEQYTGLKDKNGKEIYEGDILEIEYIHTSFIAVVAFENGFFGWIEKDSADIYPIAEYIHQGIKVIGNIHENPELLEGV